MVVDAIKLKWVEEEKCCEGLNVCDNIKKSVFKPLKGHYQNGNNVNWIRIGADICIWLQWYNNV